MSPAAFICLWLDCAALSPECTSAHPRDRFRACEVVRQCLATRRRVCEVAKREQRDEEQRQLEAAQAEREAGR